MAKRGIFRPLKIKKPKPLTAQEELFVAEYVIYQNALEAYHRAGYKRVSYSIDVRKASALKGRKAVSQAIDNALDMKRNDLDLRADAVLREMTCPAFLDPASVFHPDGRVKNVRDMHENVRRAIESIEVVENEQGSRVTKIKFVPKLRALELLGKHLRLFDDMQVQLGNLNIQVTLPEEIRNAQLSDRHIIDVELAGCPRNDESNEYVSKVINVPVVRPDESGSVGDDDDFGILD